MARCIVSLVSVDKQVGPDFNTPPMHFTIMLPPDSRLPVVSASTGFSTEGFAFRVTSNPFITFEPWRTTETMSCEPTVPPIVTGGAGQAMTPWGARHTSPTNCPLTLIVRAGRTESPIRTSNTAIRPLLLRALFTKLLGRHACHIKVSNHTLQTDRQTHIRLGWPG